MSQGTAPKRSIDEIIGSIRSIVDRSEQQRTSRPNAPATEQARKAVANDDPGVPDELTDLPDRPSTTASRTLAGAENAFAEPVAAKIDPIEFTTSFGTSHGDSDDADLTLPTEPPVPEPAARSEDADKLAEIAATVSRDIETKEKLDRDLATIGANVEADLSREFEPRPQEPVTFGRRRNPAPSRQSIDERRLSDLDAEFGTVLASKKPASARLEHADDVIDVEPAHDGLAALHDIVSRKAEDAAAAARLPALMPAPEQPVAEALPNIPDPVIDEAMLRPVIREWLDDNLPPMVERLVREELRKAIGGRR